jgi:hypothetical protein
VTQLIYRSFERAKSFDRQSGPTAGHGFFKLACEFYRFSAYAAAGGYDTAYSYDSAENDFFYSHAKGFNHYTQGFNQTSAYALLRR